MTRRSRNFTEQDMATSSPASQKRSAKKPAPKVAKKPPKPAVARPPASRKAETAPVSPPPVQPTVDTRPRPPVRRSEISYPEISYAPAPAPPLPFDFRQPVVRQRNIPWRLISAILASIFLLSLTATAILLRHQAADLLQQRDTLDTTLTRLENDLANVEKNRSELEAAHTHVTRFTDEFARRRWTAALRSIADSEEIAFRDHDDAADLIVRMSLPSAGGIVAILTMRVGEERAAAGCYNLFVRCVSTGQQPRRIADAYAKAWQRALGARFHFREPVHLISMEDTGTSPVNGTRQTLFDIGMTIDLNYPLAKAAPALPLAP